VTAAITDFTQYASLRAAADRNDPEALRAVAGQFEALFLQTMLKSMRDASLAEPLFGDSDSLEMYQDMMDKQLAVEMASGKGLGLADMIVRQLGGTTESAKPGMPVPLPKQSPIEAPPEADKPAWKDAAEFARDVWPHVKRVARTLNVAPVAILAQAALETGWGKHVMPDRDGGNSLNLFGIKAGGSWDGESVNKQTLEFEGGVAKRETARFRAYADLTSTFEDYADFIGKNPRYADVPNQGEKVGEFARALQDSGYATDPDYAKKITRVAESPFMKRILDGLKNDVSRSITHRLAPAAQSTTL
jgi:flagellar protein FlgJ